MYPFTLKNTCFWHINKLKLRKFVPNTKYRSKNHNFCCAFYLPNYLGGKNHILYKEYEDTKV